MKPPPMQCENEFCNTVRAAYQNSNAYKRKLGVLPQLPETAPTEADLEPPAPTHPEEGEFF